MHIKLRAANHLQSVCALAGARGQLPARRITAAVAFNDAKVDIADDAAVQVARRNQLRLNVARRRDEHPPAAVHRRKRDAQTKPAVAQTHRNGVAANHRDIVPFNIGNDNARRLQNLVKAVARLLPRIGHRRRLRLQRRRAQPRKAPLTERRHRQGRVVCRTLQVAARHYHRGVRGCCDCERSREPEPECFKSGVGVVAEYEVPAGRILVQLRAVECQGLLFERISPVHGDEYSVFADIHIPVIAVNPRINNRRPKHAINHFLRQRHRNNRQCRSPRRRQCQGEIRVVNVGVRRKCQGVEPLGRLRRFNGHPQLQARMRAFRAHYHAEVALGRQVQNIRQIRAHGDDIAAVLKSRRHRAYRVQRRRIDENRKRLRVRVRRYRQVSAGQEVAAQHQNAAQAQRMQPVHIQRQLPRRNTGRECHQQIHPALQCLVRARRIIAGDARRDARHYHRLRRSHAVVLPRLHRAVGYANRQSRRDSAARLHIINLPRHLAPQYHLPLRRHARRRFINRARRNVAQHRQFQTRNRHDIFRNARRRRHRARELLNRLQGLRYRNAARARNRNIPSPQAANRYHAHRVVAQLREVRQRHLRRQIARISRRVCLQLLNRQGRRRQQHRQCRRRRTRHQHLPGDNARERCKHRRRLRRKLRDIRARRRDDRRLNHRVQAARYVYGHTRLNVKFADRAAENRPRAIKHAHHRYHLPRQRAELVLPRFYDSVAQCHSRQCRAITDNARALKQARRKRARRRHKRRNPRRYRAAARAVAVDAAASEHLTGHKGILRRNARGQRTHAAKHRTLKNITLNVVPRARRKQHFRTRRIRRRRAVVARHHRHRRAVNRVKSRYRYRRAGIADERCHRIVQSHQTHRARRIRDAAQHQCRRHQCAVNIQSERMRRKNVTGVVRHAERMRDNGKNRLRTHAHKRTHREQLAANPNITHRLVRPDRHYHRPAASCRSRVDSALQQPLAVHRELFAVDREGHRRNAVARIRRRVGIRRKCHNEHAIVVRRDALAIDKHRLAVRRHHNLILTNREMHRRRHRKLKPAAQCQQSHFHAAHNRRITHRRPRRKCERQCQRIIARARLARQIRVNKHLRHRAAKLESRQKWFVQNDVVRAVVHHYRRRAHAYVGAYLQCRFARRQHRPKRRRRKRPRLNNALVDADGAIDNLRRFNLPPQSV